MVSSPEGSASLCCQSCPSLTVSAPVSVPMIFAFSRTLYEWGLVVHTYKRVPRPSSCVCVCRCIGFPTSRSNYLMSLGSLRLQLKRLSPMRLPSTSGADHKPRSLHLTNWLHIGGSSDPLQLRMPVPSPGCSLTSNPLAIK